MYSRVGQDYDPWNAVDPYVLAREIQRRVSPYTEAPLTPIPSQGPSPFFPAETRRDIDVFAPGTTPAAPTPDPGAPAPGAPPGAPPAGTPPPGGITERIQAGVLREVGMVLLLTAPAWIPIFVLPMFRARP